MKLRQQKLMLEQQLENRITAGELVNQGYLFNTSANFDSVAAALEKQQNMDNLSRGLRRRPAVEELVDQRILFDANEPVLAAQIQAMRRRQQQNVLDAQLTNRKPAHELVQSGYLMNTATNYENALNALERAQIVDNLNKGFRNRPDANVLKQQQILSDSRLDPMLQASALALEQELQANRLTRQLRERQAQQALVDAGYLYNTQENFDIQLRLLERQRAKDTVNRTLRSRPPPAVLNLRNTTAANEVNSQNMQKYVTLLNSYRTTMEQAQLDLLNAQKADTVHQQLRSRPPAAELAERGIYKSTMEQRRQSLELSQRADAVNQQLKNRPKPQQLAEAGIYKSPMEQRRQELTQSQRADTVNRGLKKRRDTNELIEAGIYKTQMDDKRQQLEQSQKMDVLNQQLKSRPDAAQLTEAGIYKTSMDQSRQELASSQMSDLINQQLKNRPNVNDLSDAGIYKTTMDQARTDLQSAQLADGMNKQLQQKPTIADLKQRQIYKSVDVDADADAGYTNDNSNTESVEVDTTDANVNSNAN
jgi:hypothetical protein